MARTYTYKQTRYSCYLGAACQAITNNLAPLLFLIFQRQFGLSFEEVGRLILVNFVTQILVDLLCVRYVDRLGHRKAMILAHSLCGGGLILLGLLPALLPKNLAYAGLTLAVIVYASGGGLLEVLMSPIADALPGDEKEAAMSMLHSFYCWGQMTVVLVSTLLLKVIGDAAWPVLPILWAIVPFLNVYRFGKVPLAPPIPDEHKMTVRQLFNSKFFLLALVMMLGAGASEIAMSQWSSLFAEEGLGVTKVLGDLLGPCLFAVFQGTGRALYGVYGSRINLTKALFFCSLLCVGCYTLTVFAPSPILSLMGCAFCGLSVSLMWPGTFSMSAARFPAGGTAMFGLLAVFGDLGCSLGPWLTGLISDLFQKTSLSQTLIATTGLTASQVGLRAGLLAAAVFPLFMLVGVVVFRFHNSSEGAEKAV